MRHKAGGLILDDEPLLAAPHIAVPDKLSTLPWHEARQYCLAASDQKERPSCAGYATAGYIEATNLAENYIAKQVDGDEIYDKAKELEGNTEWGTTLTLAIKAAQELGYLDKSLTARIIKTKREVQFALAKHRVVIAGFNITEDWQSCDPKTGWISERSPVATGGHAVILHWYEDRPEKDDYGIGGRNQWKDWGHYGDFRMRWDQFRQQFIYACVLE